MKYSRHFAIAAILLIFTLAGIVNLKRVRGEDLSSSYVGCRIVAEGNASHLYAHDAVLFNIEQDPVWVEVATIGHFTALGLLNPYVQTPLWAWGLKPICEHTSFDGFRAFFVAIFMLCTSGTIWVVSRYWTTVLFRPLWVALVCLGLLPFEPFRYGLFLLQTHIIFILLTVAALMLARQKHPLWAGLLLALAASVKITPGFLLLYWLTTRQWKAAASFVVSSALLVALTVAAVGPQVFLMYLQNMSELSNVLLVAFNNQSLASTILGHRYTAQELFIWHSFHLPQPVKLVSLLLSLIMPVLGGLLDRPSLRTSRPPYGAVFTMVTTTMFTPIAWNHYYILLVVPLMLLLDYTVVGAFARRTWLAVVAMVSVWALNVYPISYGATAHLFKAFSIPRSQFYSGLVAAAAMTILARAAHHNRFESGLERPS